MIVVSRGRLSLRTKAAVNTATSTSAARMFSAETILNHAGADALLGASITVAIARVLK